MIDFAAIPRPPASDMFRNWIVVPPNQLVLNVPIVTFMLVLPAIDETTNRRPTLDESTCGKRITTSSPTASTASSTRGQRLRRVGRSVRTTGLGKFMS